MEDLGTSARVLEQVAQEGVPEGKAGEGAAERSQRQAGQRGRILRSHSAWSAKRVAYPAYKPSGMEWLAEVPEHWDIRRMKYTASINDEALSETTNPEFEFTYVDIGSVDAVKGIVIDRSLPV